MKDGDDIRVQDLDEEIKWQETWAAADRIFEELRRSGQKFPDTTELLREDRDR